MTKCSTSPNEATQTAQSNARVASRLRSAFIALGTTVTLGAVYAERSHAVDEWVPYSFLLLSVFGGIGAIRYEQRRDRELVEAVNTQNHAFLHGEPTHP